MNNPKLKNKLLSVKSDTAKKINIREKRYRKKINIREKRYRKKNKYP
jgi:hypothetical protein